MRRNAFKTRLQIALTWLGALALIACGGGGGVFIADGGIGGTGITSSGAIQSKGSVEVNDVHYATQSSNILIEDVSGTENQLLPGMVIRLDGRIDDNGTTGVAESLSYNDNLEGPVETTSFSQPTPRVKLLRILGQSIHIEEGRTRFNTADASLNSYTDVSAALEGRILEISGFPDGSGTLLATFVRQTADAFIPGQTPVEIRERITAITASTISLNNLIVDISTNPQALSPLDGTPLSLEDLVEVKGTQFTGATLIADSVELKTLGLGDNLTQVHLEGIITQINLQSQTFELSGQPVSYALAERIIGGTLSNLDNGQRIEVEGTIIGGLLDAEKIEFEDGSRLEGNIASVDQVAQSLSIEGFPGLTVLIDTSLTDLDELTGLLDLAAGNHIEVRGRPDQSIGALLATQLRRLDSLPDPDLLLQGLPTQINETTGTLSVFGQTIDTSNLGENSFLLEDVIIGRAGFFTALGATNTPMVKLQGTLSNSNTTIWQQIEIED